MRSITLNGAGSYAVFGVFATAGTAQIQNNGGRLIFNDVSSGGTATITTTAASSRWRI